MESRTILYVESTVGTESWQVRADKAGSSPPPTSLSAVALALQSFALQREEKERQKSRSGKQAFFVGRGLIILLKQLLSYYKIFLSHHPPFFALFLFYEKKTCTKRKVGRGIEPALSARTNRSRAPTTSSRAVLAPPSTPVGFARQPSCIPTYMYSRTARIRNRALYCSVCPIITISLSESV